MAFYCIHCRSETDPKYKAFPYCGEAITDFLRRYVEMPVDGKYQLLARLGVGGMGEVYKVLHVHLKYCSPEHLGMLRAGERIDARADIDSFGIVLYEMLTGAAPFQAETPHGDLMLHASEAPRPLREVNPGATATPELEALILRALEKDRSKQFATARDFAQALEATLPALSDAPGAPAPARPAAGPTELSNPQYKQPITQIVDVAAGEDALVNVQFSDAANAPLPGFQ
jgi:serine/threonine protein kinase